MRKMPSKVPANLSDYCRNNKTELFNMWLDSNKSWEEVKLKVSRKVEGTNSTKKGWEAVQGKELRKRYDDSEKYTRNLSLAEKPLACSMKMMTFLAMTMQLRLSLIVFSRCESLVWIVGFLFDWAILWNLPLYSSFLLPSPYLRRLGSSCGLAKSSSERMKPRKLWR